MRWHLPCSRVGVGEKKKLNTDAIIVLQVKYTLILPLPPLSLQTQLVEVQSDPRM